MFDSGYFHIQFDLHNHFAACWFIYVRFEFNLVTMCVELELVTIRV